MKNFCAKDLYEAEKETLLIVCDNLNDRLDDLKGEYEGQIDLLKNYVSWCFGILGVFFSIVSIGLAVFLYVIAKG